MLEPHFKDKEHAFVLFSCGQESSHSWALMCHLLLDIYDCGPVLIFVTKYEENPREKLDKI